MAQNPAGASAAGKPRTLAGRCGSANWVCVAQCIDVTCVDKCLAEGCEQALDALAQCAEKSGCGPDDSACVSRVCGKQCGRTFEPAPPSPEKETTDPCADASVGAGKVPEEVVGRWTLEAASIRPEERPRLAGQEEGVDVKPRPDFESALVVTSGGCFLLRTKLEDATLGRGNTLEIRSWGAFQVDEKKDTVQVWTKSGQAVGPVCGKPRVIGLSKGKFQRPVYTYDVEGDTLTLTAQTPSRQTFQFRRQTQEQKEQAE
ncbi:hypothetical protein F0U60_09855 [Archangium minus]|uniref:Lipoprotein n=1 Tax=Archangium minus TaxID=83450 RepID=A0ABY9WNP1_9BACT|nr:hypothetical protein F0U60_09855 [Archangium minus]